MPSLEALIMGTKRAIDPIDLNGVATGEAIIPDVTISEMHSDEVTVTQHPVDTGANIADHAYRQPATVVCTFGWSDSSRLINSLMSGGTGAVGSLLKGKGSVEDVYKTLLELKDKRTTLKLSTAKRVYPCVIITRITTTTVDSENAAVIEITFQEILVAQAKTVTLASVQQKNPEKTASVKNGGQRYGTPAQQLLEGR